MDISAGIHDGHTRFSVPVSHTLRAFNALARPEDRISEEEIRIITDKEEIPASLQDPALKDPLYGEKIPLFRRISGNVRVTVFEGNHELLPEAAFAFLSRQKKGEKAVWDLSGCCGTSDTGTELGR